MSSKVILSEENYNFCSKIEYRNQMAKLVAGQQWIYLHVFHYWGFGDWFSFKKLILHFYPQVQEKELFELYEGSVIREDVLKYVYYVYLIFKK